MVSAPCVAQGKRHPRFHNQFQDNPACSTAYIKVTGGNGKARALHRRYCVSANGKRALYQIKGQSRLTSEVGRHMVLYHRTEDGAGPIHRRAGGQELMGGERREHSPTLPLPCQVKGEAIAAASMLDEPWPASVVKKFAMPTGLFNQIKAAEFDVCYKLPKLNQKGGGSE